FRRRLQSGCGALPRSQKEEASNTMYLSDEEHLRDYHKSVESNPQCTVDRFSNRLAASDAQHRLWSRLHSPDPDGKPLLHAAAAARAADSQEPRETAVARAESSAMPSSCRSRCWTACATPRALQRTGFVPHRLSAA